MNSFKSNLNNNDRNIKGNYTFEDGNASRVNIQKATTIWKALDIEVAEGNNVSEHDKINYHHNVDTADVSDLDNLHDHEYATNEVDGEK